MTAEDLLNSLDNLRLTLGTPKPVYWCPRACSLLLSHKTKAGAKLACRSFCKTWDCEQCRVMNTDRYGVHLAGRILSHDGPVYELRPLSDTEEALKRRLQRAKACWARFVTDDGVYYLTTDPVGSQHYEREAVPAVVRLGELVRSLDLDNRAKNCRVVTTCRAWSLPRFHSDYTCDGVIRQQDAEPVAEFFKANGIPFKELKADGGLSWALAWTMPADPTAELVDGLKAVLIPARKRVRVVSSSVTEEAQSSSRSRATHRERLREREGGSGQGGECVLRAFP